MTQQDSDPNDVRGDSMSKTTRRGLLGALGVAGLTALGSSGASANLSGGPEADAMAEHRVPYYRVPESELDAPGVVGRRVEITAGGSSWSAGDQLVDTGSSWELINAGVGSLSAEVSRSKSEPVANVKAWGAMGDGSTDDTESIQDAADAVNDSGGGVVFFPSGTFLVSDWIDFGDNTTVEGVGQGASTVLLDPDALIDGFNWGQTDDFRDRQPILTTKTKGSERASVTENLTIKNLTLDWNNASTNGDQSPAPIWIDSANDFEVEDVEVVNAEASDFDASAGDNSRGHAISVTHSVGGDIKGCWVGTANYRCIGTGIESHDISIEKNRVESANQQRHAIEVFSFTSDGFDKSSHFDVEDNTVIVDGSNGQQKAITNHGADDTDIVNNDIEVTDPTTKFEIAIHVFDGVAGGSVEDNDIEVTDAPDYVSAVNLGANGAYIEDVSASDNTVSITFTSFGSSTEGRSAKRYPIVGAPSPNGGRNRRCDITENNVNIGAMDVDHYIILTESHYDNLYQSNKVSAGSNSSGTAVGYYGETVEKHVCTANQEVGGNADVGARYQTDVTKTIVKNNTLSGAGTPTDLDGSVTSGDNV